MVRLLMVVSVISFFACKIKEKADVIILCNKIYTADNKVQNVNALLIKDSIIYKIGTYNELQEYVGPQTVKLEVHDGFVMPGIIEGHGHFLNLAKFLSQINLFTLKTYQDIVTAVGAKVQQTPKDVWIIGRGWHQEKWVQLVSPNVHGFPYHDILSAVSPDHPVLLHHASGHAILVNARAMELAGISNTTPDPPGGRILKDAQGKLTGVFEENAIDLIENVYNHALSQRTKEEQMQELSSLATLAGEQCKQYGITFFQDAGTSFNDVENLLKISASFQLPRLSFMLFEPLDSLKVHVPKLNTINTNIPKFSCNAIKAYMDGALGSRGALLLKPYTDKPDYYGQQLTSDSIFIAMAMLADEYKLQYCVHAIGDSANRKSLQVFETIQDIKHKRWRIEHAQHLDPQDFKRFAQSEIIASMQPIHCTSDAPFVEKRLGKERANAGAYVWKTLLQHQVRLCIGTDVPIESMNPFENMYAAVTRTRTDDHSSFYKDQIMTREEILKAYTIDNAYAAFADTYTGSLSEGKRADIVILDTDLMHCADSQIRKTQVLHMFQNGVKVK